MSLLTGTVCFTALVGVGALAFLTLEPQDLAAMIERVDDALLYRLSLALDDADAIWQAIGGFAGLAHLVGQGRLLFGIVVEINNKRTIKDMDRASDLAASLPRVWTALAQCLLCRRTVAPIGRAVYELAICYDKSLNIVDAVG